MKLFDLHRFVSLHHIDLADFFFNIPVHIVNHIVGLKNAGIYFDEGVFANKGIYDGLPDISRFCLCKIIISMVNLIGLHVNARHFPVFRAGEVFDDII
ncbi:hypothetical protein IMSAGC014_01058 [Bacteroidaceae bacterium]|nr:hypothetical protein IMSAGC014_01058 [Bacteroidaceae bacterium]